MATNPMRARRIQREIELIKKESDDLASRGLYFWFNENDISEMRILINPIRKPAGTEGLSSPYDGGFFLFEVNFPNDYPMEPPNLTFNPKQNTARLHPNYYQNGKVCLSIINTWAERAWASSVTMTVIAATLDSRMDENALTGEPGFEKASIVQKINYNESVEYCKYVEAIARILTGDLPLYAPFMDTIRANFMRQYSEYHCRRLEELRDLKTINCKPYGAANKQCDYPALIQKLEDVYKSLSSAA